MLNEVRLTTGTLPGMAIGVINCNITKLLSISPKDAAFS